MDGINPTLAFAALFFGLSGHPHDRAESTVREVRAEQSRPIAYQVWSDVPCLDFASVADGANPWGGFFDQDAAPASASLGDPAELAAMDDRLEHGLPMPFEEPIAAFEESGGAGGCSAPASQR